MALDTNLQGFAQQQNNSRVSDGSVVHARFLRDGTLAEIPWKWAMALEGRVFVVNFGQTSSVITGQTSITGGKPDMNLDVPSGTSIIPVSFTSVWTASTGTVSHQYVSVAQNITGNGTSNAATAGPLPARTDNPISSKCTARQAYSGAGTSQTNPIEIADFFYAFADATGNPEKLFGWYADWSAPLLLVGPASFSSYSAATTTAISLKSILTYIELPSSAIQ